MQLPARCVSIAEIARTSGYGTASFSANPYVSPESGLARGFDLSMHGHFAEMYARGASVLKFLNVAKPGASPRADGLPLGSLVGRFVKRNPWLADLFAGLFRSMGGRVQGRVGLVSPWIEPAVAKWLHALPPDAPAFCLVNFMDAHEPYSGLARELDPPRSTLEVWHALNMSAQLSRGGRREDWPEALTLLRDLYKIGVGVVDGRLGVLLRSFSEARAGRQPLVIFVGDHGQSFESAPNLFHGYGLSDEVFRVPLIVTPPAGVPKAETIEGWTSTKDVFRILEVTIRAGEGAAPDYPQLCKTLAEDGQAWALTEVPTEESPLSLEPGNHHRVGMRLVCYAGSGAKLYDPYSPEGPVLTCLGARSDSPAGHSLPLDGRPGLEFQASSFSRLIRERLGPPPSEAVSSRLAGWGYG